MNEEKGQIVYKYLTFDEWCEKYHPVDNADDFSDIEGVPLNRIWTRLCLSDADVIVNGYWRVNRDGNYVTELPYEDGENITVYLE